jgi:glycine/D-amino acid oxidase-like deaminating enzyme
MAFTPDGQPRIGEAPGLRGVLYAAGMNGHGMSLGFVTGRELARLALDRRPPPLV